VIFCSRIPGCLNFELVSGKYRGEVVYISANRIDFIIHNLGFGDTTSTTLAFHYDKLRSLISAATHLPEFAVARMKDSELVQIAKRYYGIAFELEFYVHDNGTYIDLHRFHAVK
jgi:hypothetical protein